MLEFSREIKEIDNDLFLLMKKMETGLYAGIENVSHMRSTLSDMAEKRRGRLRWMPWQAYKIMRIR